MAIAVAGFAFIAVMTLTPQPGEPTLPPSLCVVCGELALQDIILNVLLFIPFGIGLRLSGVGRWYALGIVLVTTITIELLQIRTIPGRDASLGDVITNTLGGGVGITLAESWRLWLLPTARQARRLSRAGAIICVMILAATVWGDRTALPHTIYWGQWTPDLLNFDTFPGKLLTASVDGRPFPDGPMGTSAAFRRELLSDTVLVTAAVLPGGITHRIAPIVSVYDAFRTRIFLLGQDGRDLIFSLRMHANAMTLRSPEIRLANAFPIAPSPRRADTLQVSGGVIDHQLVARVRGDGVDREYRVALGPGLGWSYFIPFEYASGPDVNWLTLLWVAGLFIALGYWGFRSEPRVEAGIVMAATAIVGFIIAPRLLGGLIGSWPEWCGAIVGIGVGWAIGAVSRRARGHARDRDDETSPSDDRDTVNASPIS